MDLSRLPVDIFLSPEIHMLYIPVVYSHHNRPQLSYVPVHSFLMRRLSSSTSEILLRAGGGNFEHSVKIMSFTTCLTPFEAITASRACVYSMIH